MSSNPHSLFLISSIIFSDSSDLLPPKATILYVVTTTPALPRNLSLLSEVKRQIWSSCMVDHNLNWKAHWSTETAFVAKQRQLFFMRHAAETPTRDFPAPQGSTIMPDLALPEIQIIILWSQDTFVWLWNQLEAQKNKNAKLIVHAQIPETCGMI